MGKKRIRVLARVPEDAAEDKDLVKIRCKDHEIFVANDADTEWFKNNIPCMTACPAETRIPEYLEANFKGDYETSYLVNREDNLFPGTLGRVCAHPCESACRHGAEGLGDPVSICWSKRTGADHKSQPVELTRPDFASGKKVAVIGSGPAGLTIGNDLALSGHSVTIYEEFSTPGGMMTAGIPPFRLPRDLVKNEIDNILSLGIELKCNKKIGEDITFEQLKSEYDAVCMTSGCMNPHSLDVPGEKIEGVESGLQFMMDVNEGKITSVKGTVVVVGGGFTAMDCSRSALRLGAEKVIVIYRRTRNELLIDDREMREASIEGVDFYFLVSPVEVISSDGNRVSQVKCIKNRLGEPDSGGRRKPIPIKNTGFTLDVDMLIPAVSQSPDASYIPESLGVRIEKGKAVVNREFMTSLDGVFGCGDFITGPRDLITVIGEGHKVSNEIDKYLTGRSMVKETYSLLEYKQIGLRTIDQWRSKNQYNYDVIPRTEIDTLKKEERKGIKQEVDLGYKKDSGQTQSERCYFCNHNIMFDEKECILCANCVEVCPLYCIKIADQDHVKVQSEAGSDPAFEKKGNYYMLIDEDKCIRCGLCLDVCPTSCISMQKLSIHRNKA